MEYHLRFPFSVAWNTKIRKLTILTATNIIMTQPSTQEAMVYNSEEKLSNLDGQGAGAAPPPQFPLRLHDILDQAEKEGYQHIVSWLPEGNGFQIHDADAMLPILQKYGFNQSRWKSFLRQLQNYGFRREIRGPNKGKCTHDLFVKGRRELCQNMRRIRKSSSLDNVNLKLSKKSQSREGLAAQALRLSQEQMNARAALSAPTLSGVQPKKLSSGVSSAGLDFSRMNLGIAQSTTRNASFNFVPPPQIMSSKTGGRNSALWNRYSLLINGADQLVWDIQKELSKVDPRKMPAEDFEPIGYQCPSSSSRLPIIVDGMNEGEVNATMCSIFLTEPSLEETYDDMW
jgi:hypothetical protein